MQRKVDELNHLTPLSAKKVVDISIVFIDILNSWRLQFARYFSVGIKSWTVVVALINVMDGHTSQFCKLHVGFFCCSLQWCELEPTG